MVYKWQCPYCGGSEFSASAHRDRKTFCCVYCGREYPNPYYEKEEADGDGEKER